MGIIDQKVNDLIGSLSRCERQDDIEFVTGLLITERKELQKSFSLWAEAYNRNPIPKVRERMELYSGLVERIDKAISNKENAQ